MNKYQVALNRRIFFNQMSARDLWRYFPKDEKEKDITDANEDYKLLQEALDKLNEYENKKRNRYKKVITLCISLVIVGIIALIVVCDKVVVSETQIAKPTNFIEFPQRKHLTGNLLTDMTTIDNDSIGKALDDMSHVKNGVWKYTNTSLKGQYHLGVDYASKKNSNVYATLSGIVIKANGSYKGGYIGNTDGRFISGGGNQIYLLAEQDGKIYCFIFMHLNKVNVKANQLVHKGEVIGTVGTSGSSSSYHCHIEMYYLGDGKIEDYAKQEYENDFGLGRGKKGYENRCEIKNAPCILNPQEYF